MWEIFVIFLIDFLLICVYFFYFENFKRDRGEIYLSFLDCVVEVM